MKKFLAIPPRMVALLQDNHSRLLKIVFMALVFITALYTKEYRGQFQAIINNQIGGIFYVLLGSLFFSIVFPDLRIYKAVLAALSITCALEIIQYFRLPFMVELTSHKVFAYIFGVSYNPADFLYYFFGAVLSLAFLKLIK